MYLSTTSGLHGQLIEYRQIELNRTNTSGAAIVKNANARVPERPYAVAYVDIGANGHEVASNGEYDLTIEQARDELDRRTSRGKYAIS